MNHKLIPALMFSMTAIGSAPALAGDWPPDDAKPLSETVKSLEEQGYSPITEVSMNDGIWEVEAYKDRQERKLEVNPATGEIISDRADDR